MSYLLLILHLFIGATLSGVGIVVVLVAGWTGIWPLTSAIVLGIVVAYPVAWIVAKGLVGDEDSDSND